MVFEYYVYALRHPVSKKIHYYGITHDPAERLRQHRYGQRAVCKWIRELRDADFEPEIEIVARSLTQEDAKLAEREMIAFGWRMDYPLLNQTSGGEGCPDLPPEIEEQRRQAIRTTWENPTLRDKNRKRQCRRMAKEEIREQVRRQIITSVGEEFSGLPAAAARYECSTQAIYKCIKFKKPLKRPEGDIFFTYTEPLKRTESGKARRTQKIRIAETGEVFESVKAVAEHFGCHPNEPGRCLKLGRKLLKKWTLERV